MLLLGFGLIIMTSASVAKANQMVGDPYYFLARQVAYVAVGLTVAFLIYQVRLNRWAGVGAWLLPVIIVLLLVVLIPSIGIKINGSRRWISLGIANIQVSEFAKIIIFVYFASYMERHGKKLRTLESYRPLFLPLIVLGIFAGLLLLEPDFGTVVVIVSTGIAMLFLGGVKLIRLGVVFIVAIVAMGLFLTLGSYRVNRVISYLDPWADATGTGYQVTNALMAIGDGGWLGSGLGGSVQKQLYLPEAHNDFIFAILADEFGFIGICITIGLFAWLIYRAFIIGLRADRKRQYFNAYIAYAIGFWLGFQSIFHIGVNLALLPSKGLTLPFMSYGGSSMVATLLAIGLLMRVHYESRLSAAEYKKLTEMSVKNVEQQVVVPKTVSKGRKRKSYV
ncbi:MAG: putative lipid II flippase FtsW [Thiotrichaceae bacterium]|nr:putative lipid II flippase FtsW [Thiotrichaceae bacterium]